ncbi:hypothetical protein Pyn_04097 [Prunus yedoensis var. nudiflora]|uniref:Uncharacterized protein n=1 Tax=Prunus yedoensis var. nudiflora TaxID=2094558 RepID=A0A314Y2Z5_PRUYE|nr:hypothetical protein Pyn_04097 [Prunus yedoensis var. nudiflora]
MEWRTEMPIPRGGPHRTNLVEPLKKSSGPQSCGVTLTGRQDSGPLPPVLPATGLITSGTISSIVRYLRPLVRYLVLLESMGSMKVQGSSIVHNQPITTLSQDDEFSFRKSLFKANIIFQQQPFAKAGQGQSEVLEFQRA